MKYLRVRLYTKEDMMAERYLGVGEIAAELGVGRGTVNTYIARGTFPDPDAYIGDTRGWLASTIKTYKNSRNAKKVAMVRK